MKQLLALLMFFSLALPTLADGLSLKDKTAIKQATLKAVAMPAEVNIKQAHGNFVRVEVTAKDVTPATVYLQSQGGKWKVVAGPGTSFSPEELKKAGVPEAVRK